MTSKTKARRDRKRMFRSHPRLIPRICMKMNSATSLTKKENICKKLLETEMENLNTFKILWNIREPESMLTISSC